MLDTLRRGAKTWVAKLLLSLLVVSFAVWGVAGIATYSGDRTVATVGETPIEATAFQRVYQRQIQGLSRQLGEPISAEMAAQFGIPQQVLGQMIADAAVTDAARSYGLGLSDEMLAKKIAEDPGLRPEGATSFDRAYLNQLLQQNGLTEEAYIAERRAQELRQQIEDGIAGGVTTPKALVEAIYRFRNEIRTVDYTTLERASVEPIPAPTDGDLQTWFETNGGSFEAPETRTATLLTVTPAALADVSAVTDEEARQEYDRTSATYTEPERRRVEQILLPDLAAAEDARRRIEGGTPFETVAAEQGLSPGELDIGLLTREEVVDPAIADAAFRLPQGEVSQPIGARFGGALVRVTEIQPEHVEPFEAVSAAVKTAIATRNAERQVQDIYEEIEDARAGGATLAEIAQRFALTTRSIEVDASGNGPDGQPVADLPERERLVAGLFDSDVGVENDPIALGRGYLWYEVGAVTPARARALDEVREAAVRAWTDDRAEALLDEKADALVEALSAGQDMASVAAGAGLTAATTEPFARNGTVPALGSVGIDAAFGGPEGHATSAPGPEGGRVVMKVKTVINPPFFEESSDAVMASRQARGELAVGLFDQYTAAMQEKLGTDVNQAMLDRVIGLGSR